MKIKRFNQLNEGINNLDRFKPDEKVLEITFNGKFYVSLKNIEEMDAYREHLEQYESDIDTSRFYGVEQYICDTGEVANHFNYKLMDGSGMYIEDEEEYDNTKKYNL